MTRFQAQFSTSAVANHDSAIRLTIPAIGQSATKFTTSRLQTLVQERLQSSGDGARHDEPATHTRQTLPLGRGHQTLRPVGRDGLGGLHLLPHPDGSCHPAELHHLRKDGQGKAQRKSEKFLIGV